LAIRVISIGASFVRKPYIIALFVAATFLTATSSSAQSEEVVKLSSGGVCWCPEGLPVEAIANVTVGYGVAVATQILIFPVLGFHASLTQNLKMGAVFTAVSIARRTDLCTASATTCDQMQLPRDFH